MAGQNSDNKVRPVVKCEWNEAVDRFAADLVADERSPLTIRNYRRELRVFAEWYQSAYHERPDLAEITGDELVAYKTAMRERRLKPGSMNVAIAALRGLVNWALYARVIVEPIRPPKVAKQAPRVPKWLTRQEERRLTKALRKGGHLQHIALVELLLVFGVRISELASLTWADVTMGRIRAELRVLGKGAKERILPFAGNQRARDALMMLGFKESSRERSRSLLHGQRGPLSASGVKQLLTPYGRAAEIEPFGAHILRHTCARRMYERDVPIQVIARWMGHENINTTLIYTLPSEADLAKAAGATDGGWDDDE